MPILLLVNRKYVIPILVVLFILAGFSACAKGPLDPARRAQVQSRDEYIRLAKDHLTHDEIFFLNEAGETLFVNALNLSPDLLAAGRARWTEDKRYIGLLEQWLPVGPPARIVLVGLYTRGIVKEDLLKNGRFRLQLRSGSAVADPLAVEEVKPEILADYFPVFNRWEKVVAVRFPADLAEASVLLVHWPSGNREVPLAKAAPTQSAQANEVKGN